MALLVVAIVVASLVANVVVLSVALGKLPNGIVPNDGSMLKVRSSPLEDPIDEFLDSTFPVWNYPLLWVAWEQRIVAPVPDDPYTLMVFTSIVPFYLTLHYFADVVPIAVLLSTYIVLSRHFLKNYGTVKRTQKRGLIAGASSVAAPSGSAGATTALTSVAATACCGAFAIENTVTIMGIALGAAGFVLLSRVFLLVMGILLLIGIQRSAKRIFAKCVLPSTSHNSAVPVP